MPLPKDPPPASPDAERRDPGPHRIDEDAPELTDEEPDRARPAREELSADDYATLADIILQLFDN
jgi:hypothetical protein